MAHPWAFTFGVLGNIISIMVYLAPVSTFYRIYRKKSTESFRSLPYIVAMFSSMLWLYYASLKKDALLLITINSFGCVVETIYIAMYIVYAPRESKVSTIKVLVSMNMGLFSFILLFTRFAVRDLVRVQVVGWICVAFSVSVFAAPLSIVAQVIRTKSVEFMPFNLSFFLTLSAVMWFAYGLFLRDICVALPNVLGFILGLVQMLLYAFYKKTKKVVTIEEKKLPAESLKSIVIISPLGTCEVCPVAVDVQPDMNEGDVKEHGLTKVAAAAAAADDDDDDSHDNKNEKSMDASVNKPQLIECEV